MYLMVEVIEAVLPRTQGYETELPDTQEQRIFLAVLGGIREVSRTRVTSPWATLSLAHIDMGTEGFKNVSYLRVLSSTSGGSEARSMVSAHAITCIRSWLRKAEIGFVTWPNPYLKSDKRVKAPPSNQINTAFSVNRNDGGFTIVVVPSVDSRDETEYLKQQRRLGRTVVVYR